MKLVSEITPEEYKELQKKHKKVTIVSVQLDPEDLSDDAKSVEFIICAASRKVKRAAASADRKDLLKIENLMIKNCVLAGDEKYLDEDSGDDDIYYGLIGEIGKLESKREFEVKKR